MSKHTKGDWKINNNWPYTKNSRGSDIAVFSVSIDSANYMDCICVTKGLAGKRDVQVANAKLISAAPDLLEACEAFMERVDNASDRAAIPDFVFRLAETYFIPAINKAKGEPCDS